MRYTLQQLDDVSVYMYAIATNAALDAKQHSSNATSALKSGNADFVPTYLDAVTAMDISDRAQDTARFLRIVGAELDDALTGRSKATGNPIIEPLFWGEKRLREILNNAGMPAKV